MARFRGGLRLRGHTRVINPWEVTMLRSAPRAARRALVFAIAFTVTGLAACADSSPVAPDRETTATPQLAARSDPQAEAVATLRYATRDYRNLDAAIADGFTSLRMLCAERPGGATGMVYMNMTRAYDGVLYPEVPDGLIYEPDANGRPKLVGVMMAHAYRYGEQEQPYQFLGTPLAPILDGNINAAIHAVAVWVWRDNPNGLTVPENPRVSCSG